MLAGRSPLQRTLARVAPRGTHTRTHTPRRHATRTDTVSINRPTTCSIPLALTNARAGGGGVAGAERRVCDGDRATRARAWPLLIGPRAAPALAPRAGRPGHPPARLTRTHMCHYGRGPPPAPTASPQAMWRRSAASAGRRTRHVTATSATLPSRPRHAPQSRGALLTRGRGALRRGVRAEW